MKTSRNGLSFIAKWEGEVDHTYLDIAGIPTIGIGHVIRPGESFPDGITHDQALQLLSQDVSTAENAVNRCITYKVTQNMFDALVSFTFNCGGGALEQSSCRSKLNTGDVAGSADALLLWDKTTINGVLTVDAGLLKRRQAERALFLTPDSPQALVGPPPPPPPSGQHGPPTGSPTPPPLVVTPPPAPVTPVTPSKSAFQSIVDALVGVIGALLKPRSS